MHGPKQFGCANGAFELRSIYQWCCIGLNIFYLDEKDWAQHTTRQCPVLNDAALTPMSRKEKYEVYLEIIFPQRSAGGEI